ncbi:MAG: DUF4116 domain-containing protein [Chlamydia sp.]
MKLDTSMIKKIEFLGNDEISANLENWKITPSSSDCYLAVEQAVNSLAGAIILKQVVLNKENLEKCNEDKKELTFNQFIRVDKNFFKSLNSNEMQSILKKCSNIAIKVVYCGTSYSISAQKLLQGYFFDQILFGSFKKYKLTCVSNQLQFTLPKLEYPFVVGCLIALTEKNPDNFKMWSFTCLALALIGANYFGHPEMEKHLIKEISDQKPFWARDLSIAVEHLFLYNKRELIPLLMKKNGLILQDVNDELKNDSQVVSAACENNPNAIQYAGAAIKDNRAFMLPLVQRNGLLLQYASEELKKDLKFVSAACQNNPGALQYAHHDFIRKSSLDMISLVEQNGLLLQYASDDLKNDDEVVFNACQNNPTAIQFASDRMRDSDRTMRYLVLHDSLLLQYASDRLKDNLRFVEFACKNNAEAIQFASDTIRGNRAFMVPFIRENKSTLKYATDKLKDDPIFVSTVMQVID